MFRPDNHNSETLVAEYLNRTGALTFSARDCWYYWFSRGVERKISTYSRAFRRMRMMGYIRTTGNGFQLSSRQSKVRVAVRHDQ